MKRKTLIAVLLLAATGCGFGTATAAAGAVPAPFTSVTLATYAGGADKLDLLARAGVRSVRFSLDWAHIQSSPASENWTDADRLVGAIASHGITPIPVLYTAPAWATAPTVLGVPVDNPPPQTAPVMLPDAPQAEPAWSTWVRDAVARYGAGGSFWKGEFQSLYPGAQPRPFRLWQIWNEPNLPIFFQPEPSPARYAELVRISDQAIKSVAPHAKVALAGMPNVGSYPGYRFLARLYRVHGFRRQFDLAAVHPYGINLKKIRRQLHRFRAVMRRAGDAHKKLWVSEYSWGSGNGGSRLNRGLAGQARQLKRTLKMLVAGRHRWKLSGASWYDVQDPPQPASRVGCQWCSFAGLFDEHGNPKPSWGAFRRLLRR
jgi:polysaccharide biosynthesis protein PslG